MPFKHWYIIHIFQSISCHYANNNVEFIDVAGSSQEIIADEVLDLAEKRTGIPKKDINFEVSIESYATP